MENQVVVREGDTGDISETCVCPCMGRTDLVAESTHV